MHEMLASRYSEGALMVDPKPSADALAGTEPYRLL